MANTQTGFKRPAFEELLTRSQADYGEATGVDVLVRRGIIPELPHMDAAARHALHGHLDWSARQGHPLYAEGAWLEAWARTWGVDRRAAAKAGGFVDVTGVDGGILAVGTVFMRTDGVRYLVTVGGLIVGGVLTVTVAADNVGVAGVEDAGVTLTLESPLANVNGSAVVGAGGLVGGADVEPDAAYRARLLTRIQKPPHGGNTADYEAWALAIPGVTRVWVGTDMGVGTVAVRFMMDDAYADGIPLAADVSTVQVAVDQVRPVTAEALVLAPVAVALNITISGLSPDTADIRTAIAAELADVIFRRGQPGVIIRRSWLWEAISLAAGEDGHVLDLPAADVTHTVGEIPILGMVTYV